MAVDLVFSQAPLTTPPIGLVFNESAAPSLDRQLAGAGTLPGLSGAATIDNAPVHMAASGYFPLLAGTSTVRYNSDTQRPVVGTLRDAFQNGIDFETGITDRMQDGLKVGHLNTAVYQDATPIQASFEERWQDATHLRRAAAGRYQNALPVGTQFDDGFQDAIRRRQGASDRYQQGVKLRSGFRSRFQDTLRRGSWAATRYQQAIPSTALVASRVQMAKKISASWDALYQDAIRPRPGLWFRPPVIPTDPCYTPNTNLVFVAPWSADTSLVFVCERHSGGPDPEPAPLFIPLLKVYMATHSLQAVLLPNMERVPLMDVTIEADADNPTWSLSAFGPGSLLEQLRSGSNAPRQIKVTVDGMPWVFAIDGFSRSRAPGVRRVQIRGHSVTSLLGGAMLPARTWLNANARTAQQLVAEALEFSGVDLDWRVADWMVPARAWSFKGKPLAAAVRIAAAVDSVVQSHPTEATLQFLSRYPLMPWEWMASTAVPDVSVSSAAITVDNTDYQDEPAWEAVYVSGTTQGISSRVRRAGTAGSVLADDVTDDLITHADAARERGRAVLGRGGRQAEVSIGMPILTGGTLPGALRVNQLLEVVEPSESWRGMVRGVRLRAGPEEVRQTLRVERHFV